VAILFSGPFEYDDPHRVALRTMTLVLEARLNDAIRQELGATYSITASPGMAKAPRPQYTVRIEWTCDPARTDALVQRVLEEVAAMKSTALVPGQMNLLRGGLLRDFERNSQDNAYLLGQIARRYEDGEAADVAGVFQQPERLATLTGEALQQAARTYLDTNRYVKVTLLPDGK
jgi:zinc protease